MKKILALFLVFFFNAASVSAFYTQTVEGKLQGSGIVKGRYSLHLKEGAETNDVGSFIVTQYEYFSPKDTEPDDSFYRLLKNSPVAQKHGEYYGFPLGCDDPDGVLQSKKFKIEGDDYNKLLDSSSSPLGSLDVYAEFTFDPSVQLTSDPCDSLVQNVKILGSSHDFFARDGFGYGTTAVRGFLKKGTAEFMINGYRDDAFRDFLQQKNVLSLGCDEDHAFQSDFLKVSKINSLKIRNSTAVNPVCLEASIHPFDPSVSQKKSCSSLVYDMRVIPCASLKNTLYIDITDDYPIYEAISSLTASGAISGYPDGTFRPDNSMNRAEFLKTLYRFEHVVIQPEADKNCFPDVTDQWFASYICADKRMHWVKADPDGLFHPERNITFAEAQKMASDVLGKNISFNSFFENGFPNMPMTRKQVVEMIYQVVDQG